MRVRISQQKTKRGQQSVNQKIIS